MTSTLTPALSRAREMGQDISSLSRLRERVRVRVSAP
jgi:hypothetical protein